MHHLFSLINQIDICCIPFLSLLNPKAGNENFFMILDKINFVKWRFFADFIYISIDASSNLIPNIFSNCKVSLGLVLKKERSKYTFSCE